MGCCGWRKGRQTNSEERGVSYVGFLPASFWEYIFARICFFITSLGYFARNLLGDVSCRLSLPESRKFRAL